MDGSDDDDDDAGNSARDDDDDSDYGSDNSDDDDSCGHIQYIPTFDFIFLGCVIVTIFIIITSRLIASIHNILFSWRFLSDV